MPKIYHYNLEYNYGYDYRTHFESIYAKNKKEAIMKVMLRIAQNWSFCFGGGFTLYRIEKQGEWNKKQIFKRCYSYKGWKELKQEDKFVNRYKHYLWNLIEKGTIKNETLNT